MRSFLRPALGFAFILSATPALAQESKTFTVNGSATLTSDYRFRGISQTDKNFALQGSLTVSHASGAYVGVWGSSVDDYIANGGDQELDLIAGFKKTIGGTTVDVGGVYYYYPGSSQLSANYNSDFLELYGSVAQTFGPATAKLTANYAPKAAALALDDVKKDNFYLNLALSSPIPNTPISLSAAVGHSFTKSFLSGGEKYTDWSVGATYTTGPVTLGLTYVDTDYGKNVITNPVSGKDLAKAGIFGSVGVAF
ncbi:MAG: TorF family putative porin [Chakrabartia sp.]